MSASLPKRQKANAEFRKTEHAEIRQKIDSVGDGQQQQQLAELTSERRQNRAKQKECTGSERKANGKGKGNGGAPQQTYPLQVANVIGVEEKLLKCPSVAEDVLRNGRQTAVPLVDVLDLPIAAAEDGNTFEHRNSGGGGGRRR